MYLANYLMILNLPTIGSSLLLPIPVLIIAKRRSPRLQRLTSGARILKMIPTNGIRPIAVKIPEATLITILVRSRISAWLAWNLP